jgi:hypothetical protein
VISEEQTGKSSGDEALLGGAVGRRAVDGEVGTSSDSRGAEAKVALARFQISAPVPQPASRRCHLVVQAACVDRDVALKAMGPGETCHFCEGERRRRGAFTAHQPGPEASANKAAPTSKCGHE